MNPTPSTKVLNSGSEMLLSGRELKFTINKRGKKRWIIETPEDREALKRHNQLQKQQRARNWRGQNLTRHASYQRRQRRKTVVKKHLPWLSNEDLDKVVNACVNGGDDYRSDPRNHIIQIAIQLGLVTQCPTCGNVPKGGNDG